jgi:hypothetical protein
MRPTMHLKQTAAFSFEKKITDSRHCCLSSGRNLHDREILFFPKDFSPLIAPLEVWRTFEAMPAALHQ